jgi:hypothetical protein
MSKFFDKLKATPRRNNVDNKFCLHRVGYQRWNFISKSNVSQFERELWTRLYQIGSGINEQKNENKICCVGDDVYLECRDILVKNDILPSITRNRNTEGKNHNKLNKADQIRANNIKNKTTEDLEALTKLQFVNLSSLNYRYVEVNIVKIIIYLKKLIHEESKDNLTELIVTLNKFILEAKQIEQLSTICLNDLNVLLQKAKNLIKFDSVELIKTKPELIFKTQYDNILKIIKEKHYDMNSCQYELFNFMKTNKSNNYLVLMHTMLSSGKTTMVLPMCGYIQTLPLSIRPAIIYCCVNETVLLDVSRMCYAMSIAFAIVILDGKTNKLIYKWSVFADPKKAEQTSSLYICDIFVARLLLEQRKDKKFILVNDEPTKDADQIENFDINNCNFSLNTELFIDLMKLAPAQTILMSATLPTYSECKSFYDQIGNPQKIIKSLSNSESKIGCALIASSGELFIPHSTCNTKSEIHTLLNLIKSNPFINRFYTFDILINMIEKFKQLNLPTIDINEFFNNPSKATQNNIQKIVCTMLEQIAETNLITQFNQLTINTKIHLKMSNIFTTNIDKINNLGQLCLIFTTNPVSRAIENFKENFGDIFKEFKINLIISNYEKKLIKHQEMIQRIEQKADDGINKTNKENKTKERVIENIQEKIYNLSQFKPEWDFPKEYQLCSESHLKKYSLAADQRDANHNSAQNANLISINDLPINTVVPNEVLILLACGIGIYSTTHTLLDDAYLKQVLILAKNRMLKFLYTDSSMAYGTNLSVTDIIIDSESKILEQHSTKTLLQMCGRAGRGGNLSYRANIYDISDDCKFINKIKSYIAGVDEGIRNEVRNINIAYNIMNEVNEVNEVNSMIKQDEKFIDTINCNILNYYLNETDINNSFGIENTSNKIISKNIINNVRKILEKDDDILESWDQYE